ncbi:MAG: terminase small subunit [Candidatus Poribacteria bacterium]|nr:terminase small subunit [Candidatus Poribacteria bacterium]
MAGTLHLQRVRCGKKNCRCASTRQEDAHKAWYRLWRDEHGNQHKTYVKRSELGAVRQAIERRQARVRREQAERRAHMGARITTPGTAQDLESLLGSAGQEGLGDLLNWSSAEPDLTESHRCSLAGSLTHRQRSWLEWYLVLLNATEAARRAGYSQKSHGYLRQIGHRNLNHATLGILIMDSLKADMMTVKARLAVQGRSDMANFLKVTPEGVRIDVAKGYRQGHGLQVKELIIIEKRGTLGQTTTTSLELHDPFRALQRLWRSGYNMNSHS